MATTESHPDAAHAAKPTELSGHHWWRILKRTFTAMGNDHLSLIAAGVAFYGLLALFPAITALMAIAGLVVEPSQVADMIDSVSSILPQDAAAIVIDQAQSVAGSESGGLGLAAILGLLLALYSASKGVGSLIEGLNIAYNETDQRGMVKQYALNFGITALLIVGVVVGIGAILVLPAVLALVPLGPVTELLLAGGRWIMLLVMAALGLALLYWIGPDRDPPRFAWLTPGALVAVVLWIGASVAFTVYASNFGSYQETFGTLAGAVLLLMWLWISALVVLLGAKLNAEAEAETALDTTVGESRPAGDRDAEAADRVGVAES